MSNLDPTGCEHLLAAIFHRARLDARGRDPEYKAEAAAFLAKCEADCADLVVFAKPGHREPAAPKRRGRAEWADDWRGPVSRRVRVRTVAR